MIALLLCGGLGGAAAVESRRLRAPPAHVPAADDVVVAEVPARATDPRAGEWAALERRLDANPRDRAAATRLARLGIDRARASGDPRAIGRAQAALSPWWQEAEPPADVILLRATIRQARHEFEAALADLDRLVRRAPGDAQAHLTRAVVLTVRGRHEEALAACDALAPLASALSTMVCRAPALSASGHGRAARALLARELAEAPAHERAWGQSVLGELAYWAGERGAAEDALRGALRLDPQDRYTRATLADLLLDERRPNEVVQLLTGAEDDDALLLRLALAEAQRRSPRAPALAARLRASFAEARRRGEAVHGREEARVALALDGDASSALALALANWEVQREPWDARVLLEAALAAGAHAEAEAVATWVAARGDGWAALRDLCAELRRRS